MKRTSLAAILLGITAVGILAAEASAYYHPTMGRFLTRDPGPGKAARTGAYRPTAGGGFISRDPTGANQYADGMNLYQYVKSAPLDHYDPLGLWRFCNKEDREWMSKTETVGFATTAAEMQAMGEAWGYDYKFDASESGVLPHMSQIDIEGSLPQWEEDAHVVHETVAAVVGLTIMGRAEGGLLGGSDKRLRSPTVSKTGRISGYTKAGVAWASGTHNLALVFELGATAASKACTCAYAKRRLQTAHVHDPTTGPKVDFQQELEDVVAFICDCEKRQFPADGSKKRFQKGYCISNGGSCDREVAQTGIGLTCKNNKVSGYYFVATYD